MSDSEDRRVWGPLPMVGALLALAFPARSGCAQAPRGGLTAYQTVLGQTSGKEGRGDHSLGLGRDSVWPTDYHNGLLWRFTYDAAQSLFH